MLQRSAGLVLSLLMASPAFTDDLAAVARKEKERRAKLANPARVYTEGDAKTGTGGSVTTMSGGASSAPAEAAATPSGPSKDEQKATWKARADAQRAEIAASEAKLEIMEREFAEFQSDVAGIPAEEIMDPMRLQKREARVVELRAQLEQQRLVVANARKSLTVLETEARKNGIPPGWLR